MLLSILLAISELVGIGLLLPFLTNIFQPGKTAFNIPGYLIPDLIISMGQKNFIVLTGCLVVLVFAVKNTAQFFVNRYIIQFGFDLQTSTRLKIINKVFNTPLVEIRQKHTSEFINMFTSASPAFANSLIMVLQFFGELLVALAVFSVLMYIDFRLTLVSIVSLISVVLIINAFYKNSLNAASRATNIHNAGMLQGMHEAIHGIDQIRVYDRQKSFHEVIKSRASDLASAQALGAITSLTPKFILETVVVLMLVLVLIIWSIQFDEVSNLMAKLGVFAFSAFRILPIARLTAQTANKLHYSSDSIKILKTNIYDNSLSDSCSPAIEASESFETEIKKFREIQLKKICLLYPSRTEPALRELSIKIKHGESVGIYGLSGSGKSTFLMLLMGVIAPSSGEVLFNGRGIAKNQIKLLAKMCAYIPQETFLISGTIIENVALSRNTEMVSKTKINDCLRKAKLEDLILSLPNGIETVIGENGYSLSGGQKQRLAIARALFFDREILILDEITSALDKKTSKEIMKEITTLKGDKTIVCVTHQLQHLIEFDSVYELRDGKLSRSKNPKR